MAGTNFSDDQDEITGINVTPLVDVMLVLLIIFMVTANYVSSSSLGLNLPEAETAATGQAGESIELIIDADSQIYVNGKVTKMSDMSSSLEDAKKKFGKNKPQALITADVLTPHGEVVKLIDLVRKNGINEFALNVEVPSAPTK